MLPAFLLLDAVLSCRQSIPLSLATARFRQPVFRLEMMV